MKAHLLVRLARRGVALHKLRSTLSALGIVFGVAAVVAMMCVSEGARREVLAELGRLGLRRISVRAGRLAPEAAEEAEALQSPGLTLRDAHAIAEVVASVETVAPLREEPVQFSSSDRRADGVLVATTPAYARTEDLVLAGGRFLTDADLGDRKRTIVLGYDLLQSLFPYDDPLGRPLQIGGEWFSIVGTLSRRERSRRGALLPGRDVNRAAFIPLTTLEREGERVDEIAVQVGRIDEVEASARLVRSVVARRHRGAHDFEMVVPKELLRGYERTRFQFSVVIGSVAAISLLVGGIGIMNIMLANVSERTREIGIRRSLGASRSDVVQQFLAEAVLLTGSGGAAGLVLGALGSLAVSSYAGWPTAVTFSSMFAALALAATTGLSFGLYPAWQAASKRPVEALRHE